MTQLSKLVSLNRTLRTVPISNPQVATTNNDELNTMVMSSTLQMLKIHIIRRYRVAVLKVV